MQFKGVGDLSKSYWNRVVKGAQNRNLPVDVDMEYVWGLFLDQDKKCKLSGVDIQIARNYTRDHAQHTASLDRIDNAKGYVQGNIQWVHCDINIMRNNWSIEDFVKQCGNVWRHYKKQNKINSL